MRKKPPIILSKTAKEIENGLGGIIECEDALYELINDITDLGLYYAKGQLRDGDIKTFVYKFSCMAQKLENIRGSFKITNTFLEIIRNLEAEQLELLKKKKGK